MTKLIHRQGAKDAKKNFAADFADSRGFGKGNSQKPIRVNPRNPRLITSLPLGVLGVLAV
jgi:hypothetical protein